MSRFAQIAAREGETVQWLEREEGDEIPETGDLEGGSKFAASHDITAIVLPLRVTELDLEAGYSADEAISIKTASAIGHKDRLIWQGSTYELGPPEAVRFRGAVEFYRAQGRKLIVT